MRMRSLRRSLLALAVFAALSACTPGSPRAAGQGQAQAPAPSSAETTIVSARAPESPAPPAGSRRLHYPPSGLELELPADMEVDLTLAPAFIRASRPNLDIKISREWSPYGEIDYYFEVYLNRFVLDTTYQKANQIQVVDDRWAEINGRRTRIVSFTRTPAPGSPETQNQYLFAYVITEGQEFYNFFFRTDSLEAQRPVINAVLESFRRIDREGKAGFQVDFYPVLPRWNQETADLYRRLSAGKAVEWGIFYPWALTNDYSRIASMEQKLSYKFPFLLHYIYLGHDFPTEGMQRAYDRGQTVELTMQVAGVNNDNVPRTNQNFAVLDGQLDDTIRRFARQAKAFRHPFLFRLNNEMNTDWSQYSGILTASDPDVYIKVWRRIYRIFEEEGVDNAIWIFNPHDRSYPPLNWNDQISFYPGNEYVHMLGLTGYNNGSYFRQVTGEYWRSFTEVYEPMVEEYRPLYGKFPWIITEFASSSVGGDKAAWIREMFQVLPRYPEIKVAVWWSYADYDYRPGNERIPARRYWLDETDEYLEAFRQGLIKQGYVR